MNRFVSLAFVALGLLSGCGQEHAGCPEHFSEGKPPLVVKPSLARETRALCYEAFATLHSGVSRTPLWSAERLTPISLAQAIAVKRNDRFHAEERLPLSERAELRDYVRSGYDRGHMAPAGDMPTETAQHESFSLANIVPQHPKNNQILWQGIEEATRTLALEAGELFVVTGPLFEGESLQRLGGRVLIPTAVFKAIYVPKARRAAAYVAPNAPGMQYQTLSIAELEARSGIDVFPALPPEVKADKMELPEPTPRGPRRRRNQASEVN
jgi:endonuclease G